MRKPSLEPEPAAGLPGIDTIPLPGGWREATLTVAGRCLVLRVPAEPERVLELALAANGVPDAERDPYWAEIWPAAHALAGQILSAPVLPAGSALELGCGSGLAGLAALARGSAVTFTDYAPIAVRAAVENARRNGCAAGGQVLDWTRPEGDPVPWIIAADVVYERHLHRPLLQTLRRLLTPEGIAWIGEPGRDTAPEFLAVARSEGLRAELFDAAGRPIAAPVAGQFTRIELRR